MKSYGEMLEDALLASSRGTHAERTAAEALAVAYPDEPGGPALLALNALWRGELEEAQRLANALGDRPPELAVRGEIEGYAGDPQGLRRIETALAAAPENPIVLRCAHSILGIDQPERALEIARRRVDLRPDDPMTYAALGTSLLAQAPEEAERLAAEPPVAFAEGHQIHTLRARLAMRRRDLPAAESHARAAVAACSDSFMAWSTLADVLRFQGVKEEAERAARYSLELNRRNPLAMRILASVAAARGDRTEAERWEAEAQSAIPALAFTASLRKANALAQKGKPKEALAELEKLKDVPGSTRQAYRTIRTTLLLDLEDDVALREEADAMEREGMTGETPILARAESERREGRIIEARDLLADAWQRRLGGAAGPLISVLASLGDLEGARKVGREAIEDVPGFPAHVGTTCLALDKVGLKAEARDLLTAGERRFPDAQVFRLLRVAAHAEDGNLAAVARAWMGLDADHRPRIGPPPPLLRLVRTIVSWFRRRKGP